MTNELNNYADGWLVVSVQPNRMDESETIVLRPGDVILKVNGYRRLTDIRTVLPLGADDQLKSSLPCDARVMRDGEFQDLSIDLRDIERGVIQTRVLSGRVALDKQQSEQVQRIAATMIDKLPVTTTPALEQPTRRTLGVVCSQSAPKRSTRGEVFFCPPDNSNSESSVEGDSAFPWSDGADEASNRDSRHRPRTPGDAQQEALFQLKEAASEIGADAVVGCRLQQDADKNWYAYGTAVKLSS